MAKQDTENFNENRRPNQKADDIRRVSSFGLGRLHQKMGAFSKIGANEDTSVGASTKDRSALGNAIEDKKNTVTVNVSVNATDALARRDDGKKIALEKKEVVDLDNTVDSKKEDEKRAEEVRNEIDTKVTKDGFKGSLEFLKKISIDMQKVEANTRPKSLLRYFLEGVARKVIIDAVPVIMPKVIPKISPFINRIEQKGKDFLLGATARVIPSKLELVASKLDKISAVGALSSKWMSSVLTEAYSDGFNEDINPDRLDGVDPPKTYSDKLVTPAKDSSSIKAEIVNEVTTRQAVDNAGVSEDTEVTIAEQRAIELQEDSIINLEAGFETIDKDLEDILDELKDSTKQIVKAIVDNSGSSGSDSGFFDFFKKGDKGKAGNARKLAKLGKAGKIATVAALATGVTSIAADAAPLASTITPAAATPLATSAAPAATAAAENTLLKGAGKLLGKLALPVTGLVSGGLEYTSEENKDKTEGTKTARAVATGGGAIGGMAAGGALGAMVGSPGGPVALVTGLLGAIAGGIAGEEAMRSLSHAVFNTDKEDTSVTKDSIKDLRSEDKDKKDITEEEKFRKKAYALSLSTDKTLTSLNRTTEEAYSPDGPFMSLLKGFSKFLSDPIDSISDAFDNFTGKTSASLTAAVATGDERQVTGFLESGKDGYHAYNASDPSKKKRGVAFGKYQFNSAQEGGGAAVSVLNRYIKNGGTQVEQATKYIELLKGDDGGEKTIKASEFKAFLKTAEKEAAMVSAQETEFEQNYKKPVMDTAAKHSIDLNQFKLLKIAVVDASINAGPGMAKGWLAQTFKAFGDKITPANEKQMVKMFNQFRSEHSAVGKDRVAKIESAIASLTDEQSAAISATGSSEYTDRAPKEVIPETSKAIAVSSTPKSNVVNTVDTESEARDFDAARRLRLAKEEETAIAKTEAGTLTVKEAQLETNTSEEKRNVRTSKDNFKVSKLSLDALDKEDAGAVDITEYNTSLVAPKAISQGERVRREETPIRVTRETPDSKEKEKEKGIEIKSVPQNTMAQLSHPVAPPSLSDASFVVDDLGLFIVTSGLV